MPVQGSPPSVQIDCYCDVSEHQLAALGLLLQKLCRWIPEGTLFYLGRIFVVPDAEVEATVNRIIRTASDPWNSFKTVQTTAKAVAVPVEKESRHYGIIVLGQSLLVGITPEHYYNQEAVSALLEELLHVSVYAVRWASRGYIQPPSTLSGCDQDLPVLCTGILDEYLVERWKASILSSQPLIDLGSGLTPVCVWFGRDIASTLDDAVDQLTSIIGEAASAQRTVTESWYRLIGCLNREIFGPLARYAGFCAGNMPEVAPGAIPTENQFYRDHVEGAWSRMHTHLDHCFQTNLTSMDQTLEAIFNLATEFLAYLGVKYESSGNKGCEITYLATFVGRVRA